MSALDDSAVRLERTGYRMTRPRQAVIEAITSTDRPFTIEEISDQLPRIGRATVFRTVKLLQELDLVCRVHLEDGGVLYESSRSDDHHHHLICSECDSVTEFVDPALDAVIAENAAALRFELVGHCLELYGRCASCQVATED